MGEHCAGWADNGGQRHPCQFADETDEFYFALKHYCRFHLPMGGKGEGGKADWTDDDKIALSDAVTARIDAEIKKPEEYFSHDYQGIVLPYCFDLSGRTLHRITFEYAQFHDLTDFTHARFSEGANFNGVLFSYNVEFRDAQFLSGALFVQAQFSNVSDFRDARFSGTAAFDGAQFSLRAEFTRAHFSSDAFFKNALFPASADFSEAQFLHHASFSGSLDETRRKASTFSYVNFKNALFTGDADFSNREFLRSADFRVHQFAKAPSFAGSSLHPDTIMPAAKIFTDRSSERAADSYRILRLAMENQRDRLNEGMFYALEQEARRRSGELTGIARIISLGYEWGSNYGLSITRPFAWLIGGIAFTTILLTGVWFQDAAGSRQINTTFSQALNHAILFSVKQSFLPFDALRSEALDYAFNPHSTGWLRVFGFFQTLYSALCILLLILAVRWRYRR